MISYRSAQKLAIWAAYAFHLLLILSLVGLLINLRKSAQYQRIEYEDDSEDTIPVAVLLTHHQWLIRTHFMMMVFFALAAVIYFYGAGPHVLTVIAAWWLYRILRGMMFLLANKPMPGFFNAEPLLT
jgi:uncharacterized membrane protein